ncbi:LUD domain-containing protein [Halostagnicola kamekurae]|uniref:L-lactate dehydrogenase complex protein LldG n=1 Tax=Halostagnicola kamekurae TaxID=619731 RepID=A0A1I6TS46_9EURY|nr:LUD domain-containing protein [Halostagnicola kamekurae]SFS92001.1 L-lactate dehydrogenase complex protein LldG [Halostagnicola kamekurae]
MRIDTTDRFADSLDAADVSCTRVEAAGFADALADVVEQPAVGVPLGIDGVSLDDTDVETTPTPRHLREAETGVTRVYGIVNHGTFVIQADEAGAEPVSLYPTTHVGVVCASDLHEDVWETASWLHGEFDAGRDSAVLATGTSATADMGELVSGVHGPQKVHAVVVTDR